MNTHDVDVVVVGSGPGGYVAAIRASQLGLKTICVEMDRLGGVCLNWGCIPTKALLKSAEYMDFLNHSSDFGIEVGEVKVDFSKVIGRSRDVADRMSNGIKFLFKKYKVQHVQGRGRMTSANSVEVTNEDGTVTDTINAKHVVLATGATPRQIPNIEVDHKYVITSTEALMQPKLPKSLVVIGAGAIGVEFAYFYRAFGVEVTIIEMQKHILPVEDVDVSKELAKNFKKAGMKLHNETKVLSAKPVGEGVEVVIEKKNGEQETIKADLALNAIGVVGNTENIGLETVGVKVDRNTIQIDEFCRTNIPNVYAIGDVAGAPWLAHKASAEGIVAAEVIAGHETQPVDYNNIPGCTYCHPQVASVGMTEAKAKEAGYELKVGKFPFTANGKAHGIGEANGFVKLVFDAKYGELLGAHMIGPDVTEMVNEMVLARSLEATGPAIFKTVHAHPTLSESIMEAAALAWGEAVNF